MSNDDVERLQAELTDSQRRRRKLRERVRLLERRIERADSELASLAATSDDPTASELGYVFIVTYGRSGSTLLQGILSSTPGWLIRGENRDAMRPLFEFHQVGLREREARLRPTARVAEHAWYGMDEFPASVSIRQIRALALATILRPEPDTRVTGFKEIRWWHHNDLPEYANFLRTVFPEARFVVNTRNLEDVARSGWWATLDDPITELQAHEQRILDLHKRLGPASFRVRYDEYVADPGSLKPLFDWLGETFDGDRIREVLARRHSY